jgi:hypothetical protein
VNVSFENKAKYFLWVAGAVTAGGAFPTMVSPAKVLYYSMDLSNVDQSPQLAPIIHAPYARHSMLGLVADGPLAAGGLWYVLRSRVMNQA